MKLLKKIVIFLKGEKSCSLNRVFTPTSAANLNYLSRPSVEELLIRDLRTPGMQIIMHGHSGSGKTSMIRNLCKREKGRFIFTQCTSKTTFAELLLNAFDQLNPYYVSEKSNTHTKTISGNLGAEYKEIKASINTDSSYENNEIHSRLLPPQLTPQKLATLMAEIDAIWVIEDFHKLPCNEKIHIADTMKIFVDSSNSSKVSKIICIGVCDSANELLKLDTNLSHRVSQVTVPLLNTNEIKEIINKGCRLLNISMDDELVKQIVLYSNQLGAVAHQMCSDICNSNNVTETLLQKKHIDKSKFNDAIQSYIQRNSDTLRNVYEATSRNSIGWYILKTFSVKGNDKISWDEIKYKVNAGKKHFADHEIKEKLQELSSETYDVIRYDINSNKYHLSSPFWGAYLKMQFQLEDENIQRRRRNNVYCKNQRDPESMLFNSILKAITSFKEVDNNR